MKTIGLLGKKLEHSFSKKYFSKKFEDLSINKEWSYENFEINVISDLNDLILQKKPIGFNVTVPYKEAILPYIHELDATAKQIGAVNTVKVIYDENGGYKLFGYNTDAHGFHQLIKPFLESQHERALILGDGGASKAVQFVLKSYGINCLIVSRKPSEGVILWEDINEYIIKHHFLIINTTPIGMYPDINESPHLPYQKLTSKHLLIDLIYNPLETVFLKKGKENNAAVLNGLTMLHQQAEKAWDIFK